MSTSNNAPQPRLSTITLEIASVGPADKIADPKVAFVFVTGVDGNGRFAKAIVAGDKAARFVRDVLKDVDLATIKDRRITIQADGRWKTSNQPRKDKDGQVVMRGGKEVFDRYFETTSSIRVLSGPPLELFRTHREAKRVSGEADKLFQEGKVQEGYDALKAFVDTLGQRTRALYSADDEFNAAVNAAAAPVDADGLVQPDVAPGAVSGAEPLRPLPSVDEAAPEVKVEAQPTPPVASAPVVPGRIGGLFRRPAPASPASAASPADQAPVSAGQAAESDPEAAAEQRMKDLGREVPAPASTASPDAAVTEPSRPETAAAADAAPAAPAPVAAVKAAPAVRPVPRALPRLPVSGVPRMR